VFSTFIKDSLDATAELTHELLNVAVNLVKVSSAHYTSAQERKEALMGAFGLVDYIPTLSSEFSLGRTVTRPDAATSTHAGEGKQVVPCQILELKNEIGTGGSDPITQAECAYSRIFSAPKVGPSFPP
jgi:hypothetical protein